MKKLIATGIAAAAFYSGPAFAVPPAPYSWTGFYIGANGGFAWNAGNTGNQIVDVLAPATTSNVPINSPNSMGGFGGGQLGYNWQRDRVVFGIETDIQGAGVSGSAASSYPGNTVLDPFTFSAKYNLDYFGTVRGRLGYAFDRTLIYATGGFAYGGVSYNAAAIFTPASEGPAYNLATSSVDTGFVVGAGFEQMLSPNWSVKAEYQYVNLGSNSVSAVYFCCSNYNNTVKFDNDFHTIRIGVNYRFGGQ
jgi:outer membrane immunogenic protein